MNERIRELVAQADIHFDVSSDHYGVDTAVVIPYDLEKFAELIIQECVSQLALIGTCNFENDDVLWTVVKSIDSIKEHFGIRRDNERTNS